MLILAVVLSGCGGGSGSRGGTNGDDDSGNVATTKCFVYAACYEAGEIRAYGVNNDDGSLSLISNYRRNEPAEPGRHLGEFTPKYLTSTGQYVYVTNAGDNTISTFAIIKDSGALQLIQDVIKSESSNSVVVTPNNNYLYLTSLQNIIAYQMNSDRTLITENKEAKVIYKSDPFQQPFSIAISQNGKYLYMGDASENTISAFVISGTDGQLSSIGTLNINYPSAIASNNQFVYVTNRRDDKVFAYTISGNGLLQPNIFPESVDTGLNPCAIAIDPKGRYVFVLSKGDSMILESTISIYAINANGSLTKKADIPNDIASGMNSFDLAIDPNGRYLFVTNGGIGNSSDKNITSFTINQNDGSLTKVGTYDLGVRSEHIICVGTP